MGMLAGKTHSHCIEGLAGVYNLLKVTIQLGFIRSSTLVLLSMIQGSWQIQSRCHYILPLLSLKWVLKCNTVFISCIGIANLISLNP